VTVGKEISSHSHGKRFDNTKDISAIKLVLDPYKMERVNEAFQTFYYPAKQFSNQYLTFAL
jgi:hypothetical protein